MIINASKSAILYRFKGNFAKTWLRQHIVQGPDGPLFRIRTHSGRLFEFPVADSHTYLGTKISYTDPQLQTLVYRMGLAKVEWSRLRKLVCSRHGLFKQDRLRIWFSSVPPTLLYGLAATGLPNTGGRQLRSILLVLTSCSCGRVNAVCRHAQAVQSVVLIHSQPGSVHRCLLRE